MRGVSKNVSQAEHFGSSGFDQSGFFPSYYTFGAPQDAPRVGVVAMLPVSAQKKGVRPSPHHSICSELHTEPSLLSVFQLTNSVL